MKQVTQGNILAYRFTNRGAPMYVESVPGDGGVDWGYTTKRENALLLNAYFAKRFASDSRYVKARFSTLELEFAAFV